MVIPHNRTRFHQVVHCFFFISASSSSQLRKKKPTRLFFSLPQHEIPDDKCLSQNDDVSSNYVDLPENYGCMSTFESVHGLISFNEQCNHIVVWNPPTSQHVTIPKPEDSRHGPRYLGYDPFGDTYKLLCIPHAAAKIEITGLGF